jgi:nitrogen-specific signal transduction histidine kinase
VDRGPGIPACLSCPWPRPLRACLACRRLGKSTKRNGNGVGINLVRTILHDLGGGLSVHSTPKGSRVSVTLPLIDKPENRP